MRGHFEYEFFEIPPCPPHFGPWDRGFGSCGRGRPAFGMHGLPSFDRHGCGPQGQPGFGHGPERRGPHFEEEHYGPPPPHHEGHGHGPHGRHGPKDHGPPKCGCHGPSEDYHGSPRWEHGPHERHHGPEHDHHGPRRCGRNKGSDNQGHDCDCRRGSRDHSPRCGPPRRGLHHGFGPGRGFGPHRHRFGPGWSPRDFFDWPSFGPHYHFGPRFGHGRPGPYGRPGSPFRDCGKCKSGPCCSGNKENQGCNDREARREENEPCCESDKNQNTTEDTVLVQKIVVRPSSV